MRSVHYSVILLSTSLANSTIVHMSNNIALITFYTDFKIALVFKSLLYGVLNITISSRCRELCSTFPLRDR